MCDFTKKQDSERDEDDYELEDLLGDLDDHEGE